MKKLLIGTTVAAVVLFFWGFLVWGALPFAWQIIGPAPDEVALQKVLGEQLPAAGAYFVPHPSAAASDAEAHAARAKAGPIATVLVHGGQDPNDPGPMIWGFVHMWLSALLMGLLIQRFAPIGVGPTIGFSALVGVAAAVWADLGRPIWYAQPWSYHTLFAVYELGGWVLAGAVLGYFVRRR